MNMTNGTREKIKIYYTYRLTSDESSKYYYGVRSLQTDFPTESACLEDVYRGSGGRKFRAWRDKYSKSLHKEIIEIFMDRDEAYAHEALLVGESYRDDLNCLNSKPGGYNKTKWPMGEIRKLSCSKHGLSSHVGNSCFKCYLVEAVSIQSCGKHGSVKHLGKTCCTCTAESSVHYEKCPSHGETKFVGSRCASCRAKDPLRKKACVFHGVTAHQNDTCRKCVDGGFFMGHCEDHGDTMFQRETDRDVCQKCKFKTRTYEEKCVDHGLVKFQNGECCACRALRSMAIKKCDFHGEVKHQGAACQSCKGEKVSHSKKHKTAKVAGCRFCA